MSTSGTPQGAPIDFGQAGSAPAQQVQQPTAVLLVTDASSPVSPPGKGVRIQSGGLVPVSVDLYAYGVTADVTLELIVNANSPAPVSPLTITVNSSVLDAGDQPGRINFSFDQNPIGGDQVGSYFLKIENTATGLRDLVPVTVAPPG